ncbi:DUF2461 domain-containing protein [Planomonospora corallina]|uniref:DUF2461 domain-containing protein n=1 Tax=Planomonospora corallina TaxID=1806052 RepID=A0ABV8IIC1_9ACTN
MDFAGFPHEAFEFYRDLTTDNSKEFWKRRREVYENAVRAPMAALAGELSEEFGQVQVLRPQRDSRFSNDKSPYKTYQGAYLDTAPCLGYWVQIDASGLYASGRFYPYDPAEVARYRETVDSDGSGEELAALVAGLRAGGFDVGGDRLKTRPRGFPEDHPRLDLLRHRKLDVGRRFGPGPRLASREALDLVRAAWREAGSLLDWVARRVRGPERA